MWFYIGTTLHIFVCHLEDMFMPAFNVAFPIKGGSLEDAKLWMILSCLAGKNRSKAYVDMINKLGKHAPRMLCYFLKKEGGGGGVGGKVRD
jgi:hypothetical protein